MEDSSNLTWLSGIMIGIISGIISGIIANAIFRYTSSRTKPKIFLCENIIKQFSVEDEPILRIKLVNQGKKPISDIKLVLYGINYLDTENNLKDMTKISESFIDFLDAKKVKTKDITDHIFQLALKNKEVNIHEAIDNYDGLLLLIRANDSYYSSSIAEYKQFDKEKIKDYTWNFIPGDNYGCTKNSRVKEPNHIKVNKWFIKNDLPKSCPLIEKPKE